MALQSVGEGEFVTLVVTKVDDDVEPRVDHEEMIVCTDDIDSWDVSGIVRRRTVKIQAVRNRLMEESSYFRGLLGGSFSESQQEVFSVEWNLETLIDVLKHVFGCSLTISCTNLLSLIESSLYFGVVTLLSRCEDWFIQVSSCKETALCLLPLDDVINLWKFGVEHGIEPFPELCTSFLARKFMFVASSQFFPVVPHKLLFACLLHQNLTVECEMHLAEALVNWLDAMWNLSESWPREMDNVDYMKILKEIRVVLLPLQFAVGKRWSYYSSRFKEEGYGSISASEIVHVNSRNILKSGDLSSLMIRLTEDSKVVNLSGCLQITLATVLLSLITSSCGIEHRILSILETLERGNPRLGRDFSSILRNLPLLTFQAVQLVDISKCHKLDLESTIELFSKSFPFLKILKAAYLLNFGPPILCQLLQKCPSVSEVDLTADKCPLKQPFNNMDIVPAGWIESSPCRSVHIASNITRITLEGRSDISDIDLQHLSLVCVNLRHLNIKGCISLSDRGISNLLQLCPNLRSFLVCNTRFGNSSVESLCVGSVHSPIASTGDNTAGCAAFKLSSLHIGGCKCVDNPHLLLLLGQTQSLTSLCVKDTNIDDNALCRFSGSSLKMLNISNTTISHAALAYIVLKNPDLQVLKARGSKNLSLHETSLGKGIVPAPFSSAELGNLELKYKLKALSLGWGLTYLTLEVMKPAIVSLKKLSLGLGGSLGEEGLGRLPILCPMLESLILYFQDDFMGFYCCEYAIFSALHEERACFSKRSCVVLSKGTEDLSDKIMIDIIVSLRCLKVLVLCFCFGDISRKTFMHTMPYLKKLKLQRVTPWMMNEDLIILSQNCENLSELCLVGCKHLDPGTLDIIAKGWPGLVSLQLEECGRITMNGASSLFKCIALETLTLRHNGCGVQKNFVLDAATKLPMLRRLSLDSCDACEGGFDVPDVGALMARCRYPRGSFDLPVRKDRVRVHKETLVVIKNSEAVMCKVVEERL